MGTPHYLDTTRLSKDARQKLLTALNRPPRPEVVSKRQFTRFAYEIPEIEVTTYGENGVVLNFKMHGRNLSCSGISMLHGGFLHKATQCRILLRDTKGKAKIVLGLVVGCRHVVKNIHEVNIQFYDKLEVSEFCGENAVATSEVSRPPDAPELNGLALCLGEIDTDRKSLSHWLQRTGLDLVDTPTLGAFADAIKRLPFTIVVCDVERAAWSARDIIVALQEASHKGAIVVVGSSEPVEGAHRVLAKPVDERAFMRMLTELAMEVTLEDDSAVYSTLDDSPESRAMIPGYVEKARALASQLQNACKDENRLVATQACQTLKKLSGQYGFGVLSQAANTALSAMDRTDTLAQASRPIGLVISICGRLSSEPMPGRQAA